MREYLVQGSINLARGSGLRIEDGRGILVYVWEGELWVTEEGEHRDHFVRRGEWLRLQRDGAAVGTALLPSVVTLTAPEPQDFARRIVLLKAGSEQACELYSSARERATGWRARLRRIRAAIAGPRARPLEA
jgi:Protein of unknown function (DUF2917)